MPILKDEYQQRVNLVQLKPYVLTRVWNWDSENDSWDEVEIARSKTLNGIKAYCRLHKIPSNTGEYRIEKETVELIHGWYPSYDTELIQEV